MIVSRLNLSQSTGKSTPRKRRRRDEQTVAVEESESHDTYASSGTVSGSIEISDVSEDGKFIKIRNMAPEVRNRVLFLLRQWWLAGRFVN